jgi:hypothetical protein
MFIGLGIILGTLVLLSMLLTMLPMQAVRLRLGTLLAADVPTLAPVAANNVHLIIAPFTEVETLTVADLTLATANGLGHIACATGSQEVAIDPVTLAQLITIVPGAGTGFRWVSSGWTTNILVYGFALIDSTGATLLAVQTFPTVITITGNGQQIDVDPIQMTFVQQPLD